MPFLEGEKLAVVDIGDFGEPNGPGQAQRSNVALKRATIQLADPNLFEFMKYPEPKLGTQPCFAKLFHHCDMLGPGQTGAKFLRKIHEKQCRVFKINQVESGDPVSVQRHQAQLPFRNRFRQMATQPLRDILNLRNHVHILSVQDLESEFVLGDPLFRHGGIEVDPVDAVNLPEIYGPGQIGQGLLNGDSQSIILIVAMNLVHKASQPRCGNSIAEIFG